MQPQCQSFPDLRCQKAIEKSMRNDGTSFAAGMPEENLFKYWGGASKF
jgi:hypothetical protein